MAWEHFTQTGRGFTPKVSFWKGGQLGFNQGAVRHFRLNQFKYVMLFYDPEKLKIGLRFTNDPNQTGIIKVGFRGKGAFISAKALLEYYQIEYPREGKYDILLDKQNALYVIQL